MIVKEYTPAPTSDRFKRAGDEAEKQMAFYLRRAFGDNPNVHVFNNLRLEHEGEVVQIDHLIFHRAGFVIVESKSVTSSVRINDREEWARQWNGRWSGMPSPVLQAKRQADLLRTLLQTHKVDLRNKILFGLKQGGFGAFIIDVVVAISDQGVIQHRGKLPEVKKADQVPDHVKALLAEHSRLAHPLSRDKRSDEWASTSPQRSSRGSALSSARVTGMRRRKSPLLCLSWKRPPSPVLLDVMPRQRKGRSLHGRRRQFLHLRWSRHSLLLPIS